jgi:hypothetical protein
MQSIIQRTNRRSDFLFMFDMQCLNQFVFAMLVEEFPGAALPVADAVHQGMAVTELY